MATQQFTSSGTWTSPVTGAVAAQGTAPGGSGGGSTTAVNGSAAGGGESGQDTFAATLGNVYTVTINAPGTGGTGAGNPGGTVVFGPDDNGKTLVLHGGQGGTAGGSPGAGGTGSTNAIHFDGGAGGPHGGTTGGGGGGSGGTSGAGNSVSSGTSGATAVTGGGPGGNGGSANANGQAPGSGFGGGGGGAGWTHGFSGSRAGGSGQPGQITLTWTPVTTVTAAAALSGAGALGAAGDIEGAAVLSGTGTLTATPTAGSPVGLAGQGQGVLGAAPQVVQRAAAALSGAGALGAIPGSPDILVVNQWAGKIEQNPLFGQAVPGACSVVVPLDLASSVGGGSGVPGQGNWLFAIAGWQQDPGLTGVTISVADDSRQWWRPAPPSNPAGITRTVIWYQPNIGALTITPTVIYVAPSGYQAGMSVTVVEVAGLGPWDTVVGLDGNYAAAATTLGLALPAPARLAIALAAVTGSNTAAGTAIAPAGWTPLHTVTASNGVDHTGDAVLAAAVSLDVTTSVAVTGTASSAEAISGYAIGVLAQGTAPSPESGNPAWPDPFIVEAGFGAGFMTPADQVEWTDVTARLLAWEDETGTEYMLQAIQATDGTALWDNPDGALSPFNPASPYFPDVVPGTPWRIRCVPPGASAWAVLQRSIKTWPQSVSKLVRGEANSAVTSLWSVVSRQLPTAFRAELLNHQPYAWWPCDDAAVIPLPTSLLNAAPGNSLPLQIVTSPNGLSSSLTSPITATYSAAQAFAAESGWMYGDPDAAAWQQSGNGSGTTGRYLACNDPNFPPLSGGVTIGWWGKLPFAATGSGSGSGVVLGAVGQPAGTLILWEIASATAPLAALALSSSGALELITWSGSTPTTHVIYSAADMRNTTWASVYVTLTQSAWQVWLNGGVIAQGSGSASMSSAWTWFLAGAGTGNSGGPPTSGTITGIPNAAHSHIAIFPRVLPAAQIMTQCMAAYTAFGQLPAPTIAPAQFIQAVSPEGAYAPDGTLRTGEFFGSPTSTGVAGKPSLAAEVTAQGGGLTSFPATPESVTIQPAVVNIAQAVSGFMWLTASGPAAPSYAWYTSQGAGAELLAATGPAAYLYCNSYGSGAAMPAAASALGDTVQYRLERLLQAGLVTTPARAIDPASSPVVAAIDTGGKQCGSAVSAIGLDSDGGFLFEATDGNLAYLSKPHLAAQQPLWQLGPDTSMGLIPYELPGEDEGLLTDPFIVKNDIAIEQAAVQPGASSSSGGIGSGSAERVSAGLTYTPSGSRYPAIAASQQQNGDQPHTPTTYLQSGASVQAQANWLFDTYGTPAQRVAGLVIEASTKGDVAPQAWIFFLCANPGDLMTALFRYPGQPDVTGTWRISHLDRDMQYGGKEQDEVSAKITVTADIYTETTWA